MSDLIIQSSALRPLPIAVRAATLADLSFIDSLQKKHTKMVGWMPTKQLEGKIRAGQVLVAEERSEVRDQKSDGENVIPSVSSALTSDLRPLISFPVPVGYAIGHDQYFKRDDVGIIYQLNVLPGRQRGLIGASLLKAMFERAAYGCRLFCCWCAQDIAANYFWESMGFVPLAFRAGSRGKDRVHIFWQRRIRAGDASTPYWFPSQTSSGAIREDRLVLPIPPGVRWNDAMPRILPGEESSKSEVRNPKQIQSTKSKGPKPRSAVRETSATASTGGLRFFAPAASSSDASLVARGSGPAGTELAVVKPARAKAPRAKMKNDPRMIAAARELRDRWLEEVNAGNYLPEPCGKYEVSRSFGDRGAVRLGNGEIDERKVPILFLNAA